MSRIKLNKRILTQISFIDYRAYIVIGNFIIFFIFLGQHFCTFVKKKKILTNKDIYCRQKYLVGCKAFCCSVRKLDLVMNILEVYTFSIFSFLSFLYFKF